ncbi:TonB-dependent receptor [Sphingobacterium thalpophilum]|uniref:TonB-dependent receptor n=1 Tax=Sphingobacterium thalpophilum TaxID=259 RepID=UPI0024A6CF6E|nr:TonB-dependent receptor [Sphingobacterium thalpophilum]
MKKSLLFFALFFASYGAIQAQSAKSSSVSGVVKEATGQTVKGATIKIIHIPSGQVFSGSADADGKFQILDLQAGGPYRLEVTYIGQQPVVIEGVMLKSGEVLNLNPTFAANSSTNLDEVVIVGHGVIDIAAGRKTPIAVSTIHKRDLEEKVGAQDITSALANTPSVYITGQAKGFGESSMTTRGFDQSNTAFLLNGQPINGMDNGSVYWSNWSGLTDIASLVQIQRGLGSSKLAISSVGGTVNYVTQSTAMKEGGFIRTTVGNDMFMKATVGYNTGLMKNGFAVSAMFTQWSGNGYTDHTEGAGQSYFLSVGYKASEKHNLNFMVTGAPQWHNQGYTSKLSNYLQHGKRFNDNYKDVNGVMMNPQKNFYHKPVANLNWDWTINDKSSLSTVVYASLAAGGGQGLKSDKYNKGGYLAADVNNHQWFGIVSNYNNKLTENLNVNVGFDVRDYKGTHYRKLIDPLSNTEGVVLGGNVNLPQLPRVTETYSTNPWKAFASKPDARENRLAWDYNQYIRYAGLFGQIEYAKDGFTAFFQGSLSEQQNIRKDYFQYTPGNEKSKDVNNFGYNTKGGLSYTLGQHTIFGNAGYYARQPYQNNIFMNYANDINENAVNEKILGLEAGYKFASDYLDVDVNVYRTTWDNRVTGSSRLATDKDVAKYNPDNDPGILVAGQFIYTTNYGVKQDHRGVELDVAARPFSGLTLTGFASVGDWKYDGKVTAVDRNDNRVELGREEVDLTGEHVGNAAQTTYGFGAKYILFKGFSIDGNYRQYNRLYSSKHRTVEEDDRKMGHVLELPSFNLLDAGLSYEVKVNDKNTMSFRVNMNNVLNKFYISEATSSNVTTDVDKTWNGIDTSNFVLIGQGRTWNASVKFTF